MNSSIKDYITVTLNYWVFTFTDGALRIIVLLHFYKEGFSPFTIALLFLSYEFAGVFTNLIGGWLSTNYGIKRILGIGLVIQSLGLLCLSVVNTAWGAVIATVWILCCQGLCGVAKDFTKTASKSAIKLTSDKLEGFESKDSRLFRWVAWFTGSKNAMKGIGFLGGGLLLTVFGFQNSLWLMVFLIVLIFIYTMAQLPEMFGKKKASRTIKSFFSKNKVVNNLALIRIFLFGARDVWFVVALPVFLYSSGWTFIQVSGLMAFWTIFYGFIQAVAPKIIPETESRVIGKRLRNWMFGLCVIPAILYFIVVSEMPLSEAYVIFGLFVFALLFAINSSFQSFLIVEYSSKDKTAEDIGFYYSANAIGRFIGTLLSGYLFQLGGFSHALFGSALMLIIGWIVSLRFNLEESLSYKKL